MRSWVDFYKYFLDIHDVNVADMSSGSDIDEFYDAEDTTPVRQGQWVA